MPIFRRKKKNIMRTPIDEIGNVVNEVGKVVDNVVTTDSERSTLKNQLSQVVLDALIRIEQIQADIIIAEAQGNWLQRSWRPMLMLVFGVIVIVATFWEVQLHNVPDNFWSLLKIGIGGYVGGRSVEKVADTVTRNIDLSYLRKRDRKKFLKDKEEEAL